MLNFNKCVPRFLKELVYGSCQSHGTVKCPQSFLNRQFTYARKFALGGCTFVDCLYSLLVSVCSANGLTWPFDN